MTDLFERQAAVRAAASPPQPSGAHRGVSEAPPKPLGPMGRLDGKVVVVTGASRGIGAEIARLFAAEGGRVVCAARTLREGEHPLPGSLETTVAEIRAAGGEATAAAANVAEPADCHALIEAARRTYGPVDVLVNNAALTYYVPVAEPLAGSRGAHPQCMTRPPATFNAIPVTLSARQR